MSGELRERIREKLPEADAGAGFNINPVVEPHPAGPIKIGFTKQTLRILAFGLYFTLSAIFVHSVQILGIPLYFINEDYYYAYMAVTKQFFGIMVNNITQWFSPTVIRMSGDASVKGQLRLTSDGRLESDFPERLVMIANHQIYTEWLYLWWISYTSRMHGHIYIILKESLKYVPVIGPGMLFYGFIFLARNWAKDKPRFAHRLAKLNKASHGGPMAGSNAAKLDPMWLLIFPEGTNLSANTRKQSARWAQKAGLRDMQHQLLPRSTGLHFCLQELRETVDWVYDCTIAYEGIPRGAYGQDIYTLRSVYFQGRPPPSVNMYWRRFAVSQIPLDSASAFEVWLRDRWTEKDALIERFVQTGRFPADGEAVDGGPAEKGGGKGGQGDGAVGGADGKLPRHGEDGYLETEVQCRSRFEFLVPFAPLTAYLVLGFGVYGVWRGLVALLWS